MQNSTIIERRGFRNQLYRTATIWAIGNALTSVTLVLYFLNSMGFYSGAIISWVFAGPFVATFLRVFVPTFLKVLPQRKKFCILFYILHIFALIFMLISAAFLPHGEFITSVIIVTCWGLASFFEGFSYTVFLSWNQALFPKKTFGRFFAFRERCRLIGDAIAFLLSTVVIKFGGTFHPEGHFPDSVAFILYMAFAIVGVLFIARSVYMLWKIPERTFTVEDSLKNYLLTEFNRLKRPFYCREFWPMLLYSALFSFFVQLEQVAQFHLINSLVLGMIMPFTVRFFQGLIMRIGQAFAARFAGLCVDRIGVLPVMAISQCCTTFALIFYIFATPESYWMVYLAGGVWISYVGLNIAIPKMQLEYSEPEDDTPWLGAYFAVGGFFGVIGVFLGGWLYDTYHDIPYFFQIIFTCALVWRMLLTLPIVWAIFLQKKCLGRH